MRKQETRKNENKWFEMREGLIYHKDKLGHTGVDKIMS